MIRISTTPNATAGAPGASVSMSPSSGMKSGITSSTSCAPPDLHVVDEDRAEDERPERAEPADDDADEQEDRERDREGVRVDERRRDREQRAGDARVEGADPERERLVAREVDAERRRGELAVADGAERAAEAALQQQPGDREQDERDRPAEVVEPLVEGRDVDAEKSTPSGVCSKVTGSVRETPRQRGDSSRLIPAPPPVNSSNFFTTAGAATAIAKVASAR